MRHSLSFSDLRPLIDLEGHEQCGFLVGTEHRICALWPTPSLRPSETRYSIGREAWEAARARSAREGVTLLGSLHTHPSGPVQTGVIPTGGLKPTPTTSFYGGAPSSNRRNPDWGIETISLAALEVILGQFKPA